MKKEQIIEQLETSLNEYKGLNEAIDDAAFYIAAEFDKLKDYSVAKEMEHKSKSIPYQLCPKCNEILCTSIAKQCALIAVDEIIKETDTYYDTLIASERKLYWQQVKTEIENL